MSETHYKTKKEISAINLKGTAWKNCSCGSWINHWENFSEENANKCSIKGCNKSSVLGAHIKLYGITATSKDDEDLSNKHFIVPMCNSHNKQANIKNI
jgi:hypothetical protein